MPYNESKPKKKSLYSPRDSLRPKGAPFTSKLSLNSKYLNKKSDPMPIENWVGFALLPPKVGPSKGGCSKNKLLFGATILGRAALDLGGFHP